MPTQSTPPTDQQVTDLAYQIHAKAHAQSVGTTNTPLSWSDALYLARQELGAAQPAVTGPEGETPGKTGARIAGVVKQLDLSLKKAQAAAVPPSNSDLAKAALGESGE